MDRGSGTRKSQAPLAHSSEPSLRLLPRGEKSEAEQLYERLAPVVNRLLWTFLGPDTDRDDVAHDIFISILRKAPTVRDASKLEAWAARVTMNALKNEFRRRRIRRWLRLDDDARDSLQYHPDFEARALLLRTHALLERLPVNERLPFSLRLLHQSSAEEIARLCGSSVRTTKRRLQAGRARFLRLAASDPLVGPRLAQLNEQGGDDD